MMRMPSILARTRTTVLVLSILLVQAVCLQAQVSIEDLLSPAFPTSLVASKDGKRIAWVFNEKGVRNIYVAEAPGFAARNLTNFKTEDGLELGSLVFVTSDRIAFVRGDAANRQGEFPNPLANQDGVEQTIWTVSWDGTMIKVGQGAGPKPSPDGSQIAYTLGGQVHLAATGSPGKKLFQARGTQGSVRWSPDGNQLAFISNRGDHAFLGVYDLQKSLVKFPDPGMDHDGQPVWSPDGKRIAFTRLPNVNNAFLFFARREGHPWSIRTVDVATGDSREVWKADPGKGSVFPSDLPSQEGKLFWIGDRIIFPWERTGWVHLYAVAVSGGAATELTPGRGEVEHTSLSLDGRSLLITTNIGDIERRHLWRVTLSGAEQLTKGEGIEWGETETVAGIACLRSDAVSPAWPALVSGAATKATGKTAQAHAITPIAQGLFPASFPKASLVVPELVEIRSADGITVPAQIFLPKDHKAGQKHPAVIFLHGGSRRQMLLGYNYGAYYHHAYNMNQYLASAGYVVLSLNYRSGIGYGLDFREAQNYGAGGASEYNDVLAAGLYLKSRADVDGAHIGLWGGSYGGFLTAHGLARNSDVFACGVDIHGVHDWNPVIRNFSPSYDAARLPDIARLAFESSPLYHVKGWKSPVLLIHGDDDRNVPFSESVVLLEQLRKLGVPTEQIVFTDEIHAFLLHESWVKTYKASAAFLDKYLKQSK